MKPTARTARKLLAGSLLAGTVFGGLLLSGTDAAAADGHGRPSSYQLAGDPAGSKFEGIGADQRRGRFYVSETTGGEIHRGHVRTAETREWLAGDGHDGRYTARGITVDDDGRIYIAGGPNGIDHPGRPDLWVYSAEGELLAALRAPGADVFLNDVTIGPDGAAYFTNSNDPQLIRVAADGDGWKASLWSDAGDVVDRQPGFNLGGIELTADRSAFVVAQGNTGRLWRFDLGSRAASEVSAGDPDLTNADGLVRQGNRLTVVQNFSRQLATLRLSADGSRAVLLTQRATDPDRVLTTAAELRGRILYLDSKFDEDPATGPYEVITDPLSR
ncbi:MAG TPA: gluconolaconase [Microlunatus sp.]